MLADRYQGRRLNSPNDLVCRSNGDIYFTDPPYGLPGRFDDPGKELPFNGVFRIAPDGALALVIDSIQVPNGIGFSPDEDALRDRWRSGSKALAGVPARRRRLGRGRRASCSMRRICPGWGPRRASRSIRPAPSSPPASNVCSCSRPMEPISARSLPGSLTSNVAWGEDGSSLFITADTRLLRMRLGTRGIGF